MEEFAPHFRQDREQQEEHHQLQQQQQVLLKRQLKTIDPLLERLDEDFYLEDGYYIYVKYPEAGFNPTASDDEVFLYFYAFTIGGTNRIYNILWGVVRTKFLGDSLDKFETSLDIVGACSYRINDKTRLDILNKVKTLHANDYFYLGSSIRDRFGEGLGQYVPEESVRVFSSGRKNKRDLQQLSEETQARIGPSFTRTILGQLAELMASAIEHRRIAMTNYSKPCKHVNECNINDVTCALYHWGSGCNLHSEDPLYAERSCSIAEDDLT